MNAKRRCSRRNTREPSMNQTSLKPTSSFRYSGSSSFSASSCFSFPFGNVVAGEPFSIVAVRCGFAFLSRRRLPCARPVRAPPFSFFKFYQPRMHFSFLHNSSKTYNKSSFSTQNSHNWVRESRSAKSRQAEDAHTEEKIETRHDKTAHRALPT